MAPADVSPRHQMPSTSSGQNVEAASANANTTELATGIGSATNASTSGTATHTAAAIRSAVDMLQSGDTLIVAGKGHEEGQTVGAVTLPFSDHAELRKALEELDR